MSKNNLDLDLENLASNLRQVRESLTNKATKQFEVVIDPPIRPFENLFLTGAPGVGKTEIAKKIMQDHIRYFDEKKDQDKILNNIYTDKRGVELYQLHGCAEIIFKSRQAKEGNELLKILTKLDGLVLDDLGVGKTGGYIPDIIYIIINKRIELGKPTIVTSNLTLKEISENIDDRLASRLSSFRYIKIEGKDQRSVNIASRQETLNSQDVARLLDYKI